MALKRANWFLVTKWPQAGGLTSQDESWSVSKSKIDFDKIYNDDELFCQFVLDPASFNLKARIHMNDPILDQMFRISRDYCFAVNATRMKMLKTESNKGVGVWVNKN